MNTTSFAQYSKFLCWIVSFIWLTLAILAFTGSSESSMLNGFLWLAGAFAFAISAIFLARGSNAGASVDNTAGNNDAI